uniref:Granzyme A-like n=2 Tax=Paramormyrops kingsleyae TaxID=1676925 RepID=A0A3B3QJI1_9TELE|nr:granzyme A-like [Paramormyrops kingsleyae]
MLCRCQNVADWPRVSGMLQCRPFSFVLLPLLLLFLPSDECAVIVDGAEVRPHSLPYMAYLNGSSLCGGALINATWVLTAAHCKGVQKVLLGVHSISKDDRSGWQTSAVRKMFPHPHYDPESHNNDIMLLKLSKKVKKTSTVSFLPLPASRIELQGGANCLVAGWGATKYQGKKSDVLRSANVTIIDNAVCNSKNYYNSVITENMLCAGSQGRRYSDSCQGDSGGPLLCKGVLRGVASFGKKCGMRSKPGVYAAVSEKYIEWIKKTIRRADGLQP